MRQLAVGWKLLSPSPCGENVEKWEKWDRLNIDVSILTCGAGDDAEELARHGFRVTAFDVAPAAIDWAKRRFPDSPVEYLVADILNPPRQWKRAFDFVLESYILQVLPASLRREAMTRIASFVKPGGALLVLARARDAQDPVGHMPWPLTREELLWFDRLGLQLDSFEDFWDDETPPVRRFRIAYHMPPKPEP
jgi:hypothetical protein